LLAEYVLLHELPRDLDAFAPESVIVGMTGPITGTGLTPGGTKLCVVYLSPATKYTLGRGATSGFLGMALKTAGYDGFIITGAAREPTYLYLDDGHAELRDARRVWGKGARDTEDLLRAETAPDARIGCIGPAGEPCSATTTITPPPTASEPSWARRSSRPSSPAARSVPASTTRRR
jgi:aldehyde:ferredoxin oxidoreductase